jgi:hypothetical protein
VTDDVWVRIEQAVQAAFDDLGVREHPPQTRQDFDSLAETVSDHVAASMPRPVYRFYRQSLKNRPN